MGFGSRGICRGIQTRPAAFEWKIRMTKSPQSKEDTAMKLFGTGAGDVDDLIFQDCWIPSDR